MANRVAALFPLAVEIEDLCQVFQKSSTRPPETQIFGAENSTPRSI